MTVAVPRLDVEARHHVVLGLGHGALVVVARPEHDELDVGACLQRLASAREYSAMPHWVFQVVSSPTFTAAPPRRPPRSRRRAGAHGGAGGARSQRPAGTAAHLCAAIPADYDMKVSGVRDQPPSVSICIPTYSRPAYLHAAIASVLSQSFTDLEVIVSDNAGDAEEVTRGFLDARVRYNVNPRTSAWPGTGRPLCRSRADATWAC